MDMALFPASIGVLYSSQSPPASAIAQNAYKPQESPWHLVRKNRLEEAEHSIKRLQTTDNAEERKRTLATIVYTNNLETELSVGTSYSDCFKGFELRRTEIAMVCFGGQLVCGLVFAYA